MLDDDDDEEEEVQETDVTENVEQTNDVEKMDVVVINVEDEIAVAPSRKRRLSLEVEVVSSTGDAPVLKKSRVSSTGDHVIVDSNSDDAVELIEEEAGSNGNEVEEIVILDD